MATTLAAKLAAASLKVGALATDKTNTQQNYAYISADKILARAGEALAQQGIVIIPAVTAEDTARYEGVDKYGKPQARYDAVVRFAMQISDGETSLEYPWVGRGSDYVVPDKALYKAITSGHKYFLMKLLNIGVGNEDGEHDEEPAIAPARTQTAQHTGNGAKAPQSAPESPTEATEQASDETAPLLRKLHAIGTDVWGKDWDKVREALTVDVSGGQKESSKDLTANELRHVIAVLETEQIAKHTQGDQWRDVLEKIAAKFESEDIDWTREQHQQARVWLQAKKAA